MASLISAPQRDALKHLSDLLSMARDPWWIFGSMALALSEIDPGVIRDIDVLISEEDAHALIARQGWANQADGGTDRYRSKILLRVERSALPIELFAGFEVRKAHGWSAIAPKSRVRVGLHEYHLFVPDVEEQMTLLKALGRPKDFERLAKISVQKQNR